jgi:TonB-dependent receptor
MKALINRKFSPQLLVLGGLMVWQMQATAQVMEEVVVQGRLRSSAETLVDERMNEEVVSDILGAEMIGRLGDSTVAAALRRVSGLTLVNDKFVYIRGLGERYSSSTLNGATIPSPDLSRNVIPLDIFPTSIVESLVVQKTYSADKSAAFGGGSIDIRTKGIPDDFTYSIEVGSTRNSESTGDMLSYAGGGDDRWGKDDGTRALSPVLLQAIQRYRGSIDPQSIRDTLRKEGQADVSVADAVVVNRQLALALNRDISVAPKSAGPDYDLKGNIGNNFIVTDDLELGFMVAGGYKSQWRGQQTISRDEGQPTEQFEKERQSTRSVDLNGSVNLGLRYTDDHIISTTSLYLRNTDDEVAVIDSFNENREKSGGEGFRKTRIKYEQREMVVNQIGGEHYFGPATKELLGKFAPQWLSDEFKVDWLYSKARASTSIPSEVEVGSDTTNNPLTGEVLTSAVSIDSGAADYRFTELDDDMTNYRWQAMLPVATNRMTMEFSAGAEHVEKLRQYRQTQFSLGALRVADPAVLSGPLGSVFSDSNITNLGNDIVFSRTGTNNQSYLAATMTDGAFGKFDVTLDDTWRVSAGARWEDYRQVALDWNIYAYSVNSPQISNDPEVLKKASYQNDKIYPSVSLTYMTDWWAEIFQLRFGWSETVIRPDLRELTVASYVDARTGYITAGNPNVRPADFQNLDLRAEWFFNNNDSLTVTLYDKQIDNPIEFFEASASDTNRAREIINAESGSIQGLEFEGLKSLGFMGEWADPFFFQGNLTLQKTELVAGIQADAPTNNVRSLTGASDYVVNLMLGYDSMNGEHAATIVYNVFGERLYVAGRNGTADGYEQPFNSLDLTYSWYPTELITVKAKLQNLLDESVVIETQGVKTFEQAPGTTAALSFNWTF